MPLMDNKSSPFAQLWRQPKPVLPLVALLLLAAFLRLFRLTVLGLEHDEVANWLIDRTILAGNHSLYFAEAYGHEAGFHYLQSLFVALLGDNALALRLPAALLGIVVVAVSYRLVKTLYNRPIALLSALIVAITFFPTFYSRLALRAIMLPVLSGLSGAFFWHSIKPQLKRTAAQPTDTALSIDNAAFYTAAILAGLSTYTYMASRVVPIFYALLFLLWFICSPQRLNRRYWAKIAQFCLLYALVAAPLLLWLQRNPGAEFRISEIDQPLQALRSGNLRPVLQNGWKILGVWGWSGDPLWRQNVAGAAIFNPLSGFLFYAGIGLMLWRRNSADLFVLLWLATATIPSLVTVDAPSTIRMINMLPLLGVPIAQVIHKLSTLSPNYPQLSTGKSAKRWITASLLLLLLGTGRTVYFLHSVWPVGGDVPFVWQTALTSAARWLDAQPSATPTTMLGWSATSMDPPTMQLALIRDDLPLRFAGNADGVDAFVLPFSAGSDVQVLWPQTPQLRLADPINTFLSNAPQQVYDDFVQFQLNVHDDAILLSSYAQPFGDEFILSSPLNCQPTTDRCSLLTLWQIATPVQQPRSIFIHALAADGSIVGQSDVELPVSASWQPGDHLYVAHSFSTANATSLRIGIYNPQTGQRLPTSEGDALQFSLDR